MRRVPRWFTGEFFGTFLLVFFGCGSVCAAVTTGAQVGVFQVAIVWGLGIATATYLTGALSGAHLNPAVTVSMAVWADFPKGRVLPYVAAQLCGAFVASAVLYYVFGDALRVFEKENGIVRGRAGSEASAMVFGEFYPNPGGRPLTSEARLRMLPAAAFGAEAIGTAVLLLVGLGKYAGWNTSPAETDVKERALWVQHEATAAKDYLKGFLPSASAGAVGAFLGFRRKGKVVAPATGQATS